nr:hypothetical protein [Jiangella asiatica]
MTRVISGNRPPPAQSPRRTNRSAADSPRTASISPPTARSATQTFSTSGVLLTAMPRALAASTSVAS